MFVTDFPRGRAICRIMLALGCGIVALLGGPVFAQTVESSLTRTFDLPADVAEKTLKLFSEQSGRGLIVAAKPAIHIRTNAVRGQFTAREALDRMLAKTGLVAKEDPKNGAFVVHRETPDPNGQRAAQTTTRDRPVMQDHLMPLKIPPKP